VKRSLVALGAVSVYSTFAVPSESTVVLVIAPCIGADATLTRNRSPSGSTQRSWISPEGQVTAAALGLQLGACSGRRAYTLNVLWPR
jgi:hypothetical protein